MVKLKQIKFKLSIEALRKLHNQIPLPGVSFYDDPEATTDDDLLEQELLREEIELGEVSTSYALDPRLQAIKDRWFETKEALKAFKASELARYKQIYNLKKDKAKADKNRHKEEAKNISDMATRYELYAVLYRDYYLALKDAKGDYMYARGTCYRVYYLSYYQEFAEYKYAYYHMKHIIAGEGG